MATTAKKTINPDFGDPDFVPLVQARSTVTWAELDQMNKDANGRNQSLIPEYVDGLDRASTFALAGTYLHNRVEVRCAVELPEGLGLVDIGPKLAIELGLCLLGSAT